MKSVAAIDRDLRRARLLAARCYGIQSIPRRAILRGDWDGGDAVRRFRGDSSLIAATNTGS